MTCGECQRETTGKRAFKGAGRLLAPPDYCGPCGRSLSPSAQQYEEFVRARRADMTRPCRVAL